MKLKTCLCLNNVFLLVLGNRKREFMRLELDNFISIHDIFVLFNYYISRNCVELLDKIWQKPEISIDMTLNYFKSQWTVQPFGAGMSGIQESSSQKKFDQF